MRSARLAVEALVVLVLVVLAVFAGLWIGDDRIIPCGARRGLDALLGEQLGHVDGPEGGGGCIVPTAGAWGVALAGAVLPVVVWSITVWRRRVASRS